MLRRKINKSVYESLSDADKAHYKANSSGDYVLDIEGDYDAVEELRRAKQHEADAHKATKAELKKLKDEVEARENGERAKAGDFDALEKSWKNKLEKANAEHESKLAALRQNIIKSTLDNTANSIASELFNSVALGLPHVKSRLAVEFDSNDVASIRVLGADGKPSALSLDDLKKELQSSEFAPILKATSASGGGASPFGGPVAPVPPPAFKSATPVTGDSSTEVANLMAHISAQDKAGAYKR